MDNLISTIKLDINDENQEDALEVEFEILPVVDISETDEKRKYIYAQIQDLDGQISATQNRIDELNAEIDRLTNHADGVDYMVAVASGVITGLVDALFVGELDINGATEAVDKKVADKLKNQVLNENIDETIKKAKEKAKEKGRILSEEKIEKIKEKVTYKFFTDPNNLAEQGGDPVLEKAIRYLEKNNPVPQDNLYWGTSSPSKHHLDDIAHHPTLAGLISSILIQYVRVAIFVNKKGRISFKLVSTDVKEMVSNWLPIIITGLLNWLVFIGEKAQENDRIKTEIPKPLFKLAHFVASVPAAIKVVKIAQNWCLHLYSDVAGSQTSAKKGNRGAGIPGLFISLLKEISSVPPLNFTGLPKFVDYIYSRQKIDLRKETAIFEELGKQTVPVVINEVLVRSFYLIRHLVAEYKAHDGWKEINWGNVWPFGNRTIARMMTISSGTFTAVDFCGAAISSGAKNGFNVYNPLFWKDLILSVNFVGIGRFAVAIGNDVGMGIKKEKKDAELRLELTKQLYLKESKLLFKTADVWIGLEKVEETVNKVVEYTEETILMSNRMLEEDMKSLGVIIKCMPSVIKNNPDIEVMIGEIF